MALRIAAFNFTPFMTFQKAEFGEYECRDGSGCDVIRFLSTAWKRKFHFVFPTDGEIFGAKGKDGKWSGILGLLQENKADFVPFMTQTYERFEVADFGFTERRDIITFAIRSAQPISPNYAFFYPFNLCTWMCILFSLLTCCVLFAVMRYKTRVKVSQTSFGESIVSSAEILVGLRGFYKKRENTAAKLLYIFTRFSMVTLTFCYTAVFLSFLMSPVLEHQIATFSELAQAAKLGNIKLAARKGPVSYISSSPQNEHLTVLGNHIKQQLPFKQISTAEFTKLLLDDFAVIEYLTLLKKTMSGIQEKQEIFLSDDTTLGIRYQGATFRKNFQQKEKLNKIILRLAETGIYGKPENDFDFKNELKKQHRMFDANDKRLKTTTLKPITLIDLKSLFIVLTIGLTLSTLVLIVERHVCHFKDSLRKTSKPRFTN